MDTKAPWRHIKWYKRNTLPSIDSCIVEPNTNTNTTTDEITQEKTIHEYRSRINEYEEKLTNGKNWEYYKKIVNPYELVYTQKKYTNFPESVCILQPLSRSYFKMIEILDITKFFDTIQSDKIITAHVCEGPGGFIEAIFNETARKRKKISMGYAMTLRSKQTNIPGWKRATNFLQKNKNIKILYGDDGTGDILKPENQAHYIEQTENKCHIFTADGGFDFSNNYINQEKLIFPLLMSSVRIGFESLRKGGMFVLKIFDMYHKFTSDLLYFLSCHFTEWTIYKPSISRPCNPEHYFIGRGYTGCTEQYLDILRLWTYILNNNDTTKPINTINSLINMEYPKVFSDTINYIRDRSFEIQTDYLEKVFFIIDKNDDTIISNYLKKNEKSSYEWCIRFSVPIYSSRYLSAVE